MARYVLPIAGAVVGGIFGGPMGAQIGWALGSALGNAVDPQVIKGPSVGDISQQTSQEGVPRPIVLGLSQPLAGNIIATSPPNIVRRTERQGKGGPKVETESVYRTYAIRICEGPIGAVLRVWRDNQLVYDARENSSMSDEENAKFLQVARFFLGDFEQNPSPDLEAVYGVGLTPAHRGTAYMVMANEDLTDRRGSIPTFQFQVASDAVSIPFQIVAVAPTATKLMTTFDGVTWSFVTPPEDFEDVVFAPELGLWVGVGERIFSSTNGTTWTQRNAGNGHSVTWSPELSLFCTVGAYGNSGSTQVYTSPDGITWTAHALPASRVWSTVKWVPFLSMFIAGAVSTGGGDSIATSPDGITWTMRSGTSNGAEEIAFSDSAVVAVHTTFGDVTKILRSTDGVTWSLVSQGTGAGLEGVTYGNGRFVATTPNLTPNGTRVWYSTDDGLSWTSGTTGQTGFWVEVIWSESQQLFYAFSTDGKVESSPDGISWAYVTTPTNNWREAGIAEGFADVGVMSLVDAIATICERAGMTPAMYDTSQLDDSPVPDFFGMTIVNTYPAYSALQALSQIYFFAPSYYDGVLHFVPSGGNSVATITEDDMLDDHDIEIEESLRDDPMSIPRVMNLMYYDVDGGLATDKQTSERAGDYRALGEQSLQSAVMMESGQAARAVAINHKVVIENLRGTLKFCLPDNWIRLVPNSPCIVQWNGLSKRVRLTKVEILDGYQQYEALHDRQSAYTSDVEGIPAAPQTAPPSNIIGPTLIEPLDIHILRDADDNAGLIYYVAVSGTSGNWTGALIELSFDGGANYDDALSTTVETIMGTLEAPLQDHPQAFPDVTHTLSVELFTYLAELDETDLEGLLNRRNFAIVGDEIIQFAEANETSEGHWELSTLLRGRKGTATQYWPAGTRFVMLDTATVGTIPASLADVGRTFTFRATSFGETVDTATVVSMVYTGRSQIEREPAYLAAHMEGVNAVITWQGVGRLGAGATVAQGVRFAGYRVTLTGANAVVITVDTDDQFLTQDVSTLTTPIEITVAQLNDLTGEGPSIQIFLGA